MEVELSPELVLHAYQHGYFPMADPDEGSVYWFSPDPRAVLPLSDFHIPRSLRQALRKNQFEVVTDRAFEEVIRACANRNKTWISEEIIRVYTLLHEHGYAHSVECWENDRLVGGLYGVALGGAFFGESMFHRKRDASKIALVHLVHHLRRGGFTLLDTQYTTPHLEQFGVIEIPRHLYLEHLNRALNVPARWES